MAPTLYTCKATIKEFEAPAVVGADGMQVHFDLNNVAPGELIRLRGGTPMLIDCRRVTGYIRSDGQMYDRPAVSAAPFDLSDPGNLGVRLLANDANLDRTVSYTVSFEYVWEGRTEVYNTITSSAPSSDSIVNL